MKIATMTVTPHAGTGVEIRGVDVRTAGDGTFAEIRDLFHHHGLLFLRDQELSEDDHIAFARRLGTINVNRFFLKHPEHPEIAMVTKEVDQRLNVGGFWHTDHSYDLEPALGSIHSRILDAVLPKACLAECTARMPLRRSWSRPGKASNAS